LLARMRTARSDGTAPFSIQARAFSSSTVIVAGSVSGLYVPMVSMNAPSRGARESATTSR
jgi:hypothetical protein